MLKVGLTGAALGVCFSFTQGVRAAVFKTIADANTTIPNSSQKFLSFLANSVSYDGTSVAFIGNGLSIEGAYAGRSTLVTLVDSATGVPGGHGNFQVFNELDFNGGEFAVEGGLSGTPGIYVGAVGGSVSKVADFSTVVPGTSTDFSGFGNRVSVSSNGAVAFTGSGTAVSGAYTTLGGSLRTLADTNTTLPGGSTKFAGFITPVLSGSSIVYGGSSTTERGLYLEQGSNSPSIIANGATPAPGQTGDFKYIGPSSFDGSSIAFVGAASNKALFAFIGSQLTEAVFEGQSGPGGGSFDSPEAFSISGNEIVLENDRTGLYLIAGGAISTIIETGGMLDGRTIASFGELSPDSFVSSSVAFEANFTDGTSGVFLATVPEPSVVMTLTPAALLVLGRRSKRGKGVK